MLGLMQLMSDAERFTHLPYSRTVKFICTLNGSVELNDNIQSNWHNAAI